MGSRLVVILSICCALSGIAGAQTPTQEPPRLEPPHHQRWDPVTGAKILPPPIYQDENPVKRMERLGTTEDPGPDPDPNRKWTRFGKVYTIQKFKRADAAYDQPYGRVRPMWQVNVGKEIYQENHEHVWVWMEDRALPEQRPSPAAPPPPPRPAPETPKPRNYVKYEGEGLGFVLQVKDEFRVVAPPPSNVTLKFSEASEGLPRDGSWRNSLDVADMNHDGKLDLVVPAPRSAVSVAPAIFLGDGKGRWKAWEKAHWPRSMQYGSAAAGDINGDGHQDIVYGVHLRGIFAVTGDGKGNFTEASEGLPNDFPTRRVLLSDVDRDGDLDIVGLSEGGVPGGRALAGSRLRVYLNDGRAKKWTLLEVADPRRQVAGDWLAVGNLNDDRYPDFAGASIIFNGTDLVYVSEGKGKWQALGRGFLPFYSYYGAVAAGRLTSRKRDDVVMTFTRFWPTNADPAEIPPPPFESVAGIDRVWFDGKELQRAPIARWQGDRPIWGLAVADFDGDRSQDIVYWDPTARSLSFLLGDGKGSFRTAATRGVELPPNTLYDIKIADVNADKRPDVILMFEADENQSNGSIRVFLGGAVTRQSKTTIATR